MSLTGFLLIAALVLFFVVRPMMKRSKLKAATSGYRPPVDWVHYHTSKVGKMQGNHQPNMIQLVNLQLLQQRRAMPSCVVWYNPKELDERVGPDHWVSVMDGNTDNDKPGHVPQHYIQTLDTQGNKDWVYKCRLKLWSVAPSVIGLLNQGPRRSEKVKATAYGSDESATLFLPMGVPGGQFAPPSLPVNDERGSSDWGTVDDLSALGAVPPTSR